MNNGGVSRRYFFFGSLLAGAVPAGGFGSTPSLKALGYKTVLDKLNIAGVGVGGRGAADLAPMAVSENIVALCDVHETYAAKTFAKYPKATKYKDFRKMLEAEAKNIDGVVIATPDHSHTPVALAAMQAGKHVYCEKPLTRTVWEARLLRDAARKYKVATQMGNQGFSHEGTRTCAEILWSGEIGSVREVHSWTGGIYGGHFLVDGAKQRRGKPDLVPKVLSPRGFREGIAHRRNDDDGDDYDDPPVRFEKTAHRYEQNRDERQRLVHFLKDVRNVRDHKRDQEEEHETAD
ncbi:MAG: Gfo/Idh/MocA family oxidoreductase [Candidatus Hydrogenedentes bacterium]|nr:Gfo/Idh/MocA family oxidoreductase [Candidatus Hydrogenedentota bacterium]